jgi:subtilisin-like proprotein convertase family protein/subtilisin family serine protease
MSGNNGDYTYYGGQKVPLRKRPDEFVVRAAPDKVALAGLSPAERTSPSSVRVRLAPADLESAMARARLIGATHHAYERQDSGQEFLITDRAFVRFKDGTSEADVAAVASKYGLVTAERLSARDFLYQLTDATGMNPVKLVVALSENEPAVERAENDLNHRAAKTAVPLPTDSHYLRQWHLHTRATQVPFDRRASSQCEAAWQALDGFGSRDVVIAITDDGCRLDHPDFGSAGKFAAWGYFQGSRLVTNADPDRNPALMYEAGQNHGTSCAGVAAADVNGLQTTGAAPGCRLLPIKWESDGPSLLLNDSKLLRALNFVADKADIVSNSWGIRPIEQFASFVTDRIAELVNSGGPRGNGILFLWAAGNENCPVHHDSPAPVPFTSGWALAPNGTPTWIGVKTARSFRHGLADKPGVLIVAALASTARRSHYSNYGRGVSLTAPSSNSHAYWRMPVPGLSVTTATGEGGGSVTPDFGGTSSATPLTAGIAALVRSANPDLTAQQVAALLKQTAGKDLDLTVYPRTPPASFDPDPTWDVSPIAPFNNGAFTNIGAPEGTWSPWFGHGRVDAAAAVAEALRGRSAATRRVEFRAAPNEVPIPDNAPGLSSAIAVADAGQAVAVELSVDIVHTWIGDLRVLLRAPDGTELVLHDREGANAKNLKKTYTAATSPGLLGLRGRPITGTWTLKVEDRAAQDAGMLKGWSIAFEVRAAEAIKVEDGTATRIPDNTPAGITRTLNIGEGRAIGEVVVSVDITHPWIGDLQVDLTPPGGSAIRLHDGAGRDADNIVRSWRASDLPALAALRGRSAAGTWTLKVADVERQDEGKLNRWSLEVT